MKKVKIIFWVVLIVFLGLIFFSNKDYFLTKQALSLKLPLLEPYHTPDMANAVFFLVFFLFGFLIAYFFSLYDRFKCKKTIKVLEAETAAQRKDISLLKGEVESLKGESPDSSAAPEAPTEE